MKPPEACAAAPRALDTFHAFEKVVGMGQVIGQAALIAVVSIAAVLGGCAALAPTPTEIPIGGVREPVTRQDRAAAREGMPGGLLEPAWLPGGFELVNVGYIGTANQVETVDLNYDDGSNYVHIWQTHLSADQLGETDPFPLGDPIAIGGDVEWHANALPAEQAGRKGVMEFSARLPDGRTVSVDSDLDADVMERVLESLYLRIAP